VTTSNATYAGETKPRHRSTAILLTFLCPGLGYMYVGEFIKGLTVNLLFLLMLEVFLITFSVLKFFPLIPFIVLVVGWIVFASMIAVDIGRRAEDLGDDYVLAGYNHWTIYAVVYLLTFLVPIGLSLDFTTNHLWRLETVDTAAMYPTLEPGDTVLVDLNAFRDYAPARGDMVALEPPGSEAVEFLRVVGVHEDIVRMEGNTLFVNDEAVDHSPLAEDQLPADAHLDDSEELLAWVEHNQGERYVISVSPRVYTELTMPPTRLEPDEYFLLADNRSQIPLGDDDEAAIRDSRNFDQIDGERLVGVPRYVFWSRDDDGSVRWERIGLRVR
jgi:signal peptidase I